MTPKLYELWPGRLWTRGRTNELSPADHEAILVVGPTLVVSVCPRPDKFWMGYMPGDRVLYWHRPMADGKRLPPSIEALADEIAETERPTLIYCNAGRNRSVFLAGLVMTRLGLSGAEAIERIDRTRPNALANPLFRRYLAGAPAVSLALPAGTSQCITGGLTS